MMGLVCLCVMAPPSLCQRECLWAGWCAVYQFVCFHLFDAAKHCCITLQNRYDKHIGRSLPCYKGIICWLFFCFVFLAVVSIINVSQFVLLVFLMQIEGICPGNLHSPSSLTSLCHPLYFYLH